MKRGVLKYIALLMLLVLIYPAFATEVVVSPRAQALSYEMMTDSQTLSEQLGLDSQSSILSTDVDIVNGQLVLDRLIALSDPDYSLVPGDTISISFMERTGTDPVNIIITIPYGGTIRISSIATIESADKTFQEVRSEIEAALTPAISNHIPQRNAAAQKHLLACLIIFRQFAVIHKLRHHPPEAVIFMPVILLQFQTALSGH